MNNAKLVLLGVLAAGLAVTGCTRHMARNDAAPPSAETATAAADVAPAAQPAPAPENAADAGGKSADGAVSAPAPLPAPMTEAAAGDAAAPASGSRDAAPPPAPAATDAAASTQPGPGAVKEAVLRPLPPAEITDTINKLTHNPRVRYLSSTAQYDYYVGGRLDARYDLNHDQLIITGANEGDALKCEYGKDGTMISDGKVPPKVVGACNALIDELGGYLSH